MATIRVGVAGLGDAGKQVLEAASGTPGFRLAAVADTRKEALEAAHGKYGVKGFDSVLAMCGSPDVDVVYIATPNRFHIEHAIAAAENRKHLIVVKPLALTLEDSDKMIGIAERNGVKLVYGHSRIYDPPVRKIAEIVRSGELGRLIQVNTWMYGGWLQRKPRLASELSTDSGGGVVFRQGPHQVDIIRSIGGGLLRSVRAISGRWDPHFGGTEGNYTAYLEFQDGTPATMAMNGYGYFSTTELTHGMEPAAMATREKRYREAADETTKYGSTERRSYYFGSEERSGRQPFYGLTIVSCQRGDIRQSQSGLYVYTAEGREEISCPSYDSKGRASVAGALLALSEAIAGHKAQVPDGRWAKATLEVCLAMLESNSQKREVLLSHQVPSPW